MPDGDGAYILRRLKENPVTKTIPVIVITGRRNHSLERTMFNLGAAEFLTKPVDLDTLWSKLRPYVETRHAPRTADEDVSPRQSGRGVGHGYCVGDNPAKL